MVGRLSNASFKPNLTPAKENFHCRKAHDWLQRASTRGSHAHIQGGGGRGPHLKPPSMAAFLAAASSWAALRRGPTRASTASALIFASHACAPNPPLSLWSELNPHWDCLWVPFPNRCHPSSGLPVSFPAPSPLFEAGHQAPPPRGRSLTLLCRIPRRKRDDRQGLVSCRGCGHHHPRARVLHHFGLDR